MGITDASVDGSDLDPVIVEDLPDEFVYEEIVYKPFSPQSYLKKLNLSELYEQRILNNLLEASLPDSYKLIPFIHPDTDPKLSKLFVLSRENLDVANFYFQKDSLITIILSEPASVPKNMISPKLTFGELSSTYENLVAYGNESTGAVTVKIDGILFTMDTIYYGSDSIDLEDDTEILLIQFWQDHNSRCIRLVYANVIVSI